MPTALGGGCREELQSSTVEHEAQSRVAFEKSTIPLTHSRVAETTSALRTGAPRCRTTLSSVCSKITGGS